ncbi:head-tail adaptor protein [Caulobacter vibrioides]|uniref:head-tail adaptor protein n=1 Tax=Caulobacter vibrioides TaxID=155892 RepID=UPI0013DDFCF0|nr:head-tail adaptor protein [Caulobacter vibrioides]
MRSGEFRERVQFQQRAEDANGDRLGDWETEDRFKTAARYTFLRGGETVMQARLTGVQPVVIRVRASGAMREVTADFRVLDLRTGAAFNIRSVLPDLRRKVIDFTCDTGGADG